MKNKLPKSLFKYRVCNDNNFNALINNFVWMSAPVTFGNDNDIFDSRIIFTKSIFEKLGYKLFPEVLNETNYLLPLTKN